MPSALASNSYVRIWLPSLLSIVALGVGSVLLGSSDRTGHLLRELVTVVVPHVSAVKIAEANHLVRKCCHFVGYALLGMVFLRSWWATLCIRPYLRDGSRQNRRGVLSRYRVHAAGLAFLSTALIASLDEWRQLFLPGRTASWRDVVLDCMAAAVIQVVVLTQRNLRVHALPSDTSASSPWTLREN